MAGAAKAGRAQKVVFKVPSSAAAISIDKAISEEQLRETLIYIHLRNRKLCPLRLESLPVQA